MPNYTSTPPPPASTQLLIQYPTTIKHKRVLNLINHESNIDEIFLYAKDPYEAKHQLLIKKRESTDIKCLNDSKGFLKYSNDMDENTIHLKNEKY